MREPLPLPRKARRTNLLVATLATAIALILVETAIRVGHALREDIVRFASCEELSEPYDSDAQCYTSQVNFPPMEYHSYLGYVPKKSTTGVGYTINSQHLRYDEDLSPQKPTNETRIFFTGGSTAFGAGVKQHQLYTTQLEKALSASFPGHQMRVVSAGVGAYGTVQERILIENDLLDLKPDVLVMFSGWNDTYFGYAGKDIRRDQDYMNFRARLGEETKSGELQTFSAPRFANYSLKLHYLADRLIHRLTLDEKELSKDVAARSLPPDIVVQTLQRNVNIVVDIARRHGFDFVFYLQPTLYSTSKLLTEWERNILQRNRESLIGFAAYNRLLYVQLRSELKEDAAREGYIFIDGDEAIASEPRTLFVDHVHFGDRGNAVIARHLFGLLESIIRGRM